MRFPGPCLAAACALTGGASAQLAASASYELHVLDLDGGGGGACSAGYAAFVTLPGMPNGDLASAGYTASIGFLATSDPEPGNAPVVFGIEPWFGPREGGTAVTISGLNFDKLGAGSSAVVDFGGAPAAAVSVLSDTQLTCTTPPGGVGPQDVVVGTFLGSATVGEGFVYTPAILSSPTVVPGGTVEIENLGPVGWTFDTYWSPNTTYVPLPPFGVQLIGPAPLSLLYNDLTYTGPDGIHTATVPIPPDPALVGFTAHLQSGAMLPSPFQLVLTNATSTTIL